MLDLGLPDMDGLDVYRHIRPTSNVPITLLTARDEETDQPIGLELEADDHIPKTFSPKELVARVRAILRRITLPGKPRELLQTFDPPGHSLPSLHGSNGIEERFCAHSE